MRAPSLRLTIPAVAALAAVAFLPSLWAGFAADDYRMLSTVEALDGPLWAFERNDLGEVDGGHFYRPLWVLLNFAALELGSGGATAFHAVNLALYALIAVQVLLLVRSLTGRPGAALLAAVAFAVYPRHAESVAWASGNTDLLATALCLAALQAALAPWRARRRILAAAALTVLAALAKESAFVLPALAALALWLRAEPAGRAPASRAPAGRAPAAGGLAEPKPEAERWRRWATPVAMAAALVPVLVLRTLAIGGLGGYDDGWPRAIDVLGSIASYAIATVTPHQVEVLRHPWLAVVPVALLALAAAAAWRLHAARAAGDADADAARRRTLALGLAWFAVALLPVLGEPLDLNNATGERLLFLPSVGLAIALAALVPERLTRKARRAALALALSAAASLSLASATNWIIATEIADRTLDQALAQAPPQGGELLLLSIPESYRNGHVFTNSLDRAVERAGRPDLRVSWCVPVHIRDTRAGAVRFEPRLEIGAFLGLTEPDAPFDFPVIGDPDPLSAGCSYERPPDDEGPDAPPGLGRRALARPVPQRPALVVLVFDGENLVRAAP